MLHPNNSDNEFNATVTGSVTVPLDAGDYVEIYVYVGYSGDVTRYVTDSNGGLDMLMLVLPYLLSPTHNRGQAPNNSFSIISFQGK